MNKEALINIANTLMGGNKGLLAMDESIETCNKRFAEFGMPQTVDARRDWRELIANTAGLGKYISGAILSDETIQQKGKEGKLIVNTINEAGIIPGIKVDLGTIAMAGFPGEKVTEGLDGLRERLKAYFEMGARFAKWRAVFTIEIGIPSNSCIEVNAYTLARYAALCQEVGLVPIVEPEVLMDGKHNLEACFEVTEKILRAVFTQLYRQRILFQGMILKPNMVISGVSSNYQSSINEIADATIRCLLQSVPAAVAGIAFLSGGQTGELASVHLNAMHVRFNSKLPWPLTFSFARAIQQPAMGIWQGAEANVHAAQESLYHRAKCNHAANLGHYSNAMEIKQI